MANKGCRPNVMQRRPGGGKPNTKGNAKPMKMNYGKRGK